MRLASVSLVPAGCLLAFTLGACASTGKWFTRLGYHNGNFAYLILYENAAERRLLPEPWQLDNYVRDSGGFDEKTRGAYLGVREMDENADGEIKGLEKRDEPIYDLKLVSGRDNGVVWAKAHPLRFVDRDKELRVVVDNYIDSLSGAGLYEQGSLFNVRHVRERTFTTFLESERDLVVDRHPAVEAVFEIAEVEKVKLDPNYRKTKVKVVFVRFEYDKEVTSSDPPSPWPKEGLWYGTSHRRGILVLGFANGAAAFDRAEPQFDGLVQRVRFPKSTPAEALSPVLHHPDPSASAPTPDAPPRSGEGAM